jgi:hypothetical protein
LPASAGGFLFTQSVCCAPETQLCQVCFRLLQFPANSQNASGFNMEVVILSGGVGIRLCEIAERIPKPMAEIGGRPILWQHGRATLRQW